MTTYTVQEARAEAIVQINAGTIDQWLLSFRTAGGHVVEEVSGSTIYQTAVLTASLVNGLLNISFGNPNKSGGIVALSSADGARLQMVEDTLAATTPKVTELEEVIDKSKLYHRAGSGNTSRYVYQNTVDGLDTGAPLIAEYPAIAITTDPVEMQLLLTDPDSKDKFLLEGNYFAYDVTVSHHYKEHHTINAAGKLYQIRPDASLDELALEPTDPLSGYTEQ